MSKGKRYNENDNHSIFKKILIFILIILIITLITLAIFYITTYIKNKSNTTDTTTNSTIEITKKIIDLEDIEIVEMNIKSSSEYSIIKISFKNISNIKVNACEINLYLLDENESVIFGTSLQLPDMEVNAYETFSVLCSSNITNVADYKVVLNK